MNYFTKRHSDKIAFTLSCFDRIIITGSLVAVGHAQAMTGFIRQQGIRIFEYPDWANRFREDLRAHAETVARDNGVEIDFIQRKNFRNCHIRDLLHCKSAGQISAIIRRLRKHGPIKKVARNYKYYLTALGRRVTAVALKLREMFIIPTLSGVINVG